MPDVIFTRIDIGSLDAAMAAGLLFALVRVEAGDVKFQVVAWCALPIH